MTERLSKRSICQFLLLVVAGLFCLFLLIEILLHARPHASPSLKNGSSTLLLPNSPVSLNRTVAELRST